MKKKTLYIVRMAALLALLLVLQFATKPLGQLVTGSAVNLVLVLSTLAAGLQTGAEVAVLSPFLAFLLQIAPMPIVLVPGVAVGNIVLVTAVHYGAKGLKGKASRYAAAGIAAVLKFAALWLVMTKLLIPLAGLEEAKAAVLTASFTWPQLFTALIGGQLAATAAPRVKKAITLKHIKD